MNADAVLLGVDLGGAGLKAAVVDGGGRVLGTADCPVTTQRPKPGWAEQRPQDWYQALVRTVPRALAAAGVHPRRIVAMSISAGAHIGVLTGAAGVPLRPAIFWSDQRAIREAEQLEQRLGALCRRHALNRPNPTWLLPQLLWLRQHEPEILQRVERLYLAKDWLRSRLTGDWHTDAGDAVGSMLVDWPAQGWSRELLFEAGLDMHHLPPMVPSTRVVGSVTPSAAEEVGVPPGTPVVCGSIDTTVESCAAGACAPGEGVVKLASAGVLYLVTAQAEVVPPISCYPHLVEGRYYAATGTNTCAAAHQWLRDLCFAGEAASGSSAEAWRIMDRMAELVPAGSEDLLFHPYLQGERAPLWDPRVRGDFIGITLRHGRGHFVRALYEGIAYGLRHAMDAARERGFTFGPLRLIGGGARSRLWAGILSSVLDKPLVVPAFGDAAVASALVAGSGVGAFPEPEHWSRVLPGPIDYFEPVPNWRAHYAKRYVTWLEAVERLREVNHRLSG
jgi:xylulokinase